MDYLGRQLLLLWWANCARIQILIMNQLIVCATGLARTHKIINALFVQPVAKHAHHWLSAPVAFQITIWETITFATALASLIFIHKLQIQPVFHALLIVNFAHPITIASIAHRGSCSELTAFAILLVQIPILKKTIAASLIIVTVRYVRNAILTMNFVLYA